MKRGLECKSKKSRDTWSNKQAWPWGTEWSRAKSNRVLKRGCTGHSKHRLPKTGDESKQGHHKMVNTEIRLIISFASKDEETLSKSAKTRPGADCGSDHEPLIGKFRHKWKKVKKTTRSLRYDLNWIPYDYTVEVTNRFKGLDLIEYVKNYGQTHSIALEGVTVIIPKKKKCKEAKCLSEEALQIAEKRREVKSKG